MEVAGLPTLNCVPYLDANGTHVPCSHKCADGESFKRYHAKLLSDRTFDTVEHIQEAIF